MSPSRFDSPTPSSFSFSRIVAGVVALIFVVAFLLSLGKLVQNVNADEIAVFQGAIRGGLRWEKSAGIKAQMFDGVTVYKKRDIYHFDGITVNFNDGGTAKLHGSIQYDMPLDDNNLTALHTRYGSQEAIKTQVIEKVVNKVLYMTGPLMSSRESYAEKRTDLIRFVQDQIDHGVYKVESSTVETTDQLTGGRTTAVRASVARNQAGQEIRQESSIVGEFGIKAFNFAIEKIEYDTIVQKQIAQQQEAIMGVQTAIANARKSEQDRITVEQQGMAAAAKAKWEQETYRAAAIVVAERERDVARLAVQQAEAYKQEQLLKAEADSTYKRRVMEADGALAQKLTTIENVAKVWADAFAKSPGPLVPSVVMGGNGGSTSSVTSVQSLVDLIMTKYAKDLAVDLKPVPVHDARK